MQIKFLHLYYRRALAAVRKRAVWKGAAVMVTVAAICYMLREYCSRSRHTGSNGMNLLPHYLKLRTEQDRRAGDVGCRMPPLDPFSEEIMQYREDLPPIVCSGNNWVECYKSECYVKKEILNEMDDVTCIYRDVLYKTDYETAKGEPITKASGERYKLVESDHVEVNCTGKKKNSWNPLDKLMGSHYYGYATGLRPLPAHHHQPPAGDKVNVAIILLDSTSHCAYIREMANTRQYLAELGAVILNSYNIVGDGTAGAMFPILTGRNFREVNGTQGGPKLTIDPKDFIFHHFKDLGYRTAFFEDYPVSGVFQMHYNGFKYEPVDDYLRTFTLEVRHRFCAGSVPKHTLLMNLADQFMQMADKYFILSMTTLAHDNDELLSTIDADFAAFLKGLKNNGRLNNTLLFVIGDHGARFQGRRNTFQGRLEERLPLVAIILPETLKKSRPDALESVKSNADVLTTPYDLHSTILDAVGLADKANHYKEPNSDLTRGLSLLRPIPRGRRCGEAGVSAHWCACAAWRSLPLDNAWFHRAAEHLASYINELTAPQRSLCVERNLTSVEWVQKLDTSDQLLKNHDRETKGYQVYQAKITMGPLLAKFEGTLVYDEQKREFSVDSNHISRVNKYNKEPHCILKTHLDLHRFCLCKDVLMKHVDMEKQMKHENRSSQLKT